MAGMFGRLRDCVTRLDWQRTAVAIDAGASVPLVPERTGRVALILLLSEQTVYLDVEAFTDTTGRVYVVPGTNSHVLRVDDYGPVLESAWHIMGIGVATVRVIDLFIRPGV